MEKEKMSPEQRMQKYNEKYDKHEKEINDLIICSLYSFDFNMQKLLDSKYNYYVLDDMSIINIWKDKYSQIDLKKHLIILDSMKIIYRFTVAKKFMVMDESLKQLRLNSWGKEYYKKMISESLKENVNKRIKEIIEKDLSTYECVVKEFEELKLNTRKIALLNRKLRIKIVF